MSCATTPSFTLYNDLPDPLRLTFLSVAIGGAAAPFDLPASQRWLAPRQSSSLALPAEGTGWLVGERRVWRGVVAVHSHTHVVRRADNTSVLATVGAPSPQPLVVNANQSFVLLMGAERQALRLCSEPPVSSGRAATRCHGLLPAFGRRYLRQVPAGTVLEAYEPVWGKLWQPAPSGGEGRDDEDRGAQGRGGEGRDGSASRGTRISRVLPLASAGYAATYEAHVASEAAAPPAGTLALMNHLPHPAVLCRTDSTGAATGEAGAAAAADGGAGARNAAGAASEVQLDCALGVPAREFIELEHGSLRVLNSTRSASSASSSAPSSSAPSSASSESWDVYELVQLLEHTNVNVNEKVTAEFRLGPASALLTSPPPPPPPPPGRSPQRSPPVWRVTNHFGFTVALCELPVPPSKAPSWAPGKGAVAGVGYGAELEVAARLLVSAPASCVSSLPAWQPLGNQSSPEPLAVTPLRDTRTFPRARVLVVLRLVQAVTPGRVAPGTMERRVEARAAAGAAGGAASGAAGGDAAGERRVEARAAEGAAGRVLSWEAREVGLGIGPGAGVWTPSRGFVPRAELSPLSASVMADALTAALTATLTAASVPVVTRPAPDLSVDATCAARHRQHPGVLAALAGLRRHWGDVTSAVYAGEVNLDLPPDAVELGTDADPVRKLLLLKAMRELPDTHPYAILGAHCRAGTRTPAEADACRERLSRRVELSLHHESVALNSTATFRAPSEGREKLYSQPFVFNVECAALLCAYTRILAAQRPYALLHRDFKVEVGHASPFNSRLALEALFSVLARRFAGRTETLRVVEFASGNMYGAVPALAALADLGFVKIEYHLVDKEYADCTLIAC